MGFFRQQEIKMAVRLLAWQYEREHLPVPGPAGLEAQAEKIVDEAHRIARERGGNLLSILKDLIRDLRKG
jgi:hypothetical protein